jgi:hypothetical protein
LFARRVIVLLGLDPLEVHPLELQELIKGP